MVGGGDIFLSILLYRGTTLRGILVESSSSSFVHIIRLPFEKKTVAKCFSLLGPWFFLFHARIWAWNKWAGDWAVFLLSHVTHEAAWSILYSNERAPRCFFPSFLKKKSVSRIKMYLFIKHSNHGVQDAARLMYVSREREGWQITVETSFSSSSSHYTAIPRKKTSHRTKWGWRRVIW